MKNRRLAIAGLALTTAIGVAGCGTSSNDTSTGTPTDGTTTAAPAAPADATAELAAAAGKLAEDTAKVTVEMAGTMSMTGVVDPKAQKAVMEMTLGAGSGETKVQIRKVGTDMYMKFGGSLAKLAGEGKWLHVDAATLAAGSSFDIMPSDDPAGAQAMIKAMSNAESDGKGGFKGTLDLTKTPKFNKDAIKGLGNKATAVPFTATVDAQGRLSSMTVDMSGIAAGAGAMKTTYSDFGTAVDVKAPPASQVTEAPKEITGLLNA